MQSGCVFHPFFYVTEAIRCRWRALQVEFLLGVFCEKMDGNRRVQMG